MTNALALIYFATNIVVNHHPSGNEKTHSETVVAIVQVPGWTTNAVKLSTNTTRFVWAAVPLRPERRPLEDRGSQLPSSILHPPSSVPPPPMPPLPSSILHPPSSSSRSRARATAAERPAPYVTLAWTASPSPEVTGYALYHSATGLVATLRTDVGNVLTAILGDLVAGTEYTIYATAYDTNGVESVPSNVITYTPPIVVLPPTEIHVVVTPQSASALAGPWTAVPEWPAQTLTNPVGSKFYRMLIK